MSETNGPATATLETIPPAVDTPRITRLADLLGELEADAARRAEAKRTGRPLGPRTGLDALDHALGDFLQPGLHMLHGNTGCGKTALGLQVACTCGFPALYVTCEMGPLELLRRAIARTTETYLGKLKSGELTASAVMELAHRTARECHRLTFCDATTVPAPTGLIEAALHHIRSDAEHVLLVVDSLHSWAEAVYPDTVEYDALNLALADLRRVAAHLECPVVAVAERNRQTVTKGGLNSGAGTRKIEYGAETVLDLERDAEAGEDAFGEAVVKLKVCKNRNGAVRTGDGIALRFHGALQRFREA